METLPYALENIVYGAAIVTQFIGVAVVCRIAGYGDVSSPGVSRRISSQFVRFGAATAGLLVLGVAVQIFR